MKIFLSGDRSLDPATSALAVMQLSGRLPVSEVADVYTGDLAGIEGAVRYLLPGVNVVESSALDTGKPDLDARHEHVRSLVDMAVFVHPDPLDSRIYQSLVNYFEDDNLTVVQF